MTSVQESVKLSAQEGDSFFLQAFRTQSWLTHLEAQAAAEYREHKNRRYRVMQTSQAQRGFLHVFGPVSGAEFAELLENLYRFTEYDHPLAALLFRALVPLSMEHESTGEFMEPRLPTPDRRPHQAAALLWQSLERWCDWLDAVIHLVTHARWHLEGHAAAADSRNGAGPLPTANGSSPSQSQRLIAQHQGHWPCQELDEVVIALWPLVKRHNWTHADLLSVLRDLLRRPEVWPCQNEAVLAGYCADLGLHKIGRGETAKGSRPTGYEVALRLCPTMRPPGPPGEPPWFEACPSTA